MVFLLECFIEVGKSTLFRREEKGGVAFGPKDKVLLLLVAHYV